MILFPSLITLSLIKYYQLLLSFPDTSWTLSVNTRVGSVANSCHCGGVVGWERLQGNALIKEGEMELMSNKQASASRREKDPNSPESVNTN